MFLIACVSSLHLHEMLKSDGFQDARVSQQEEVAAEVAQLFKDHPDLQADFRVFMPGDHPHMLGDSSDMALLRQRTGTPIRDGKGSKRKVDSTQVTSVAAPTVPQKRKRKVLEKEKEREKEIPLKTGPSSKVSHFLVLIPPPIN
jgi:histone deacetylase complex regulatory component SIN3